MEAFRKLFILIWKEYNYRSILWTIAEITLSIIFIIVVNLGTNPPLLASRTARFPDKPFVISSGNRTEENIYCQSNMSYGYEPRNDFLEKIINETGCLLDEKFYGTTAGLKKKDSLRFKFFDGGEESIPKFLNYEMHTVSSLSYPFELWTHKGSSARSTNLMGSYNFSYRKPDVLKVQNILNSRFRSKMQPSLMTPNITAKTQNGNFFVPASRIVSPFTLFIPILLFVWECSLYLKTLVKEKNSGLKVYLTVMGFSIHQVKIAGFVVSMIVQLFNIILATIFLYVPFKETSHVLLFVHPLWIFFHLTFSAVNLTHFQWFLSIFFKNDTYAIFLSLSLMVLPVVSLLGFYSSYESLGNDVNRLSCLIPSLLLTKGFSLLLDFEVYGKRVRFLEKLAPELHTALTVGDILLMHVICFLFYFVLGLYFERVIPGNSHTTLPFNFFLKTSYWRPKRLSLVSEVLKERQNKETFEAAPANLKVAISVRNLSKKYSNGVVALDNVSIDFFEGEIVGLLGHNGAGKSTLFSILAGMFKPSSGEVSVYGIDIKDLRKEIDFGYCPQHDILLDATVSQNIAFFAMAKGLSLREAREEAKKIILRLGMEKSKHVRATKLSGGQRRKLSLAVSLSGNPQIILLDEPTTGIDVTMRREIWNIILELRGSKTIILCTHLLEEADVLCNRIAVLSRGRIQCYGSPMFLKSKYGTGFVLSIVATDTSKGSLMMEIVKKYVKTAEFKYKNMLTLVFKLTEKELPNFPALFEELDLKKSKKEIVSYTLTISTMEDVFLNIDRLLKQEFEEQRNESEKNLIQHSDSEHEYQKSKHRNISLCLLRMSALIIKKWIYVRSHFFTYFIVFGFFLILTTLAAYYLGRSSGYKKTISYSLGLYGKPEILYATDGNSNSEKEHLIDSFRTVIKQSGGSFRKVDNIALELKRLWTEDFEKLLKSMIAIQFLENSITIMYNGDANYALPVAVDLVHNAFLLSNDSYVKTPLTFEVVEGEDEENSPQLGRLIIFWIMFLFFERYIFLMSPFDERKTGVKTLQLLLVSPVSYWISHLIIDLIIIFAYSIVAFSVAMSVNEEISNAVNLRSIIGQIILYCIGILLTMYIYSSLFGSYLSSIIFDILTNIILGVAAMKGAEFFIYFSPTLRWMFMRMTDSSQGDVNRLEYYCIVAFLVLILIDIRVFPIIFHKLATCIFRCCRTVRFDYEHPKDDTVEHEKNMVRNIIKNKQLSTKMLVVDDLKRWYCSCRYKKCACCSHGPFVSAVKGVSFVVEKGEIFGLVGSNGAGKTSIFGVISGALVPSGGTVYMESINLLNICLKYKTFSRMGYCPQFSCILPTFKGKEMLQLFARLRGCSGSLLKQEVKKWIERTDLTLYATKKCGNYSGGNKRKLSIGIALIGNPSLALLDEPATGIDASARRLIWDLISDFRKGGGSAILTTHSMEECETLCSRLTIMTKGQMRLVGELTTLKNIYGQGYTVYLKLGFNATDDQRLDLQKAMEKAFGDACRLTDIHLTVLQYEIKKEAASWKKLFENLNGMKTKFTILESFLASSTTLEQIFMDVSRD